MLVRIDRLIYRAKFAAAHESPVGTFRKYRNVQPESGMRTIADVRFQPDRDLPWPADHSLIQAGPGIKRLPVALRQIGTTGKILLNADPKSVV